jgi:membrane-associated phospholipid phosphatase
MCKFTTIILLLGMFSIFCVQAPAQNADIEMLRSLNRNASTVGYSRFISNTTTEVALGVPIIMGAVALIEKNDDLLKNALYVGVSVGVDGVLTYGLKHAINRQRPAGAYPNDITNWNRDFENETSLSFPSGHTSLAFTTATALSLKYPKWYVIVPSYLWAGSVGYSRMNLGMHYPTDVLAGAFLGAGSAFVTYKINEWFWKKNNNKKIIGLQSYL